MAARTNGIRNLGIYPLHSAGLALNRPNSGAHAQDAPRQCAAFSAAKPNAATRPLRNRGYRNLHDRLMTASNVLIDGGPTSPEIVAQKITQAMQALRATGLRTAFIEQGPMFDAHVAEHELQRLRNDFEGSQSITRADHLASVAQTRRLRDAFDT